MILLVGMSPGFAQTPEEYTLTDPQNDDASYQVNYGVTGAAIDNILIYPEHSSIVVTFLKASEAGNFTIQLPRTVIDAKNGTNDEQYSVLVNNLSADYNETKTSTDRTIAVQFSKGTKQIEIIGTWIVPEFGGLSYVVLIIAIFSTIFLSAKSRLKSLH